MKKTIFVVSIVLLALLAVTCDNGILSVSPASNLGPAGDPDYVTITIGISDDTRARAMTLGQAQGVTPLYLEVVFVATGKTPVRSTNSWNGTAYTAPAGTWTMSVPQANYNGGTGTGEGKAVIFAGRQSDMTLVAVGIITTVNSVSSTTINGATATVTFTMSAITSGVAVSGGSFTLSPAGNVTSETVTDGTSKTAPAFEIPDATTTINATYTFNIPNSTYVIAAGSPDIPVINPAAVGTSTLIPTASIGAGATINVYNITINTSTLTHDTGIAANNYSKISFQIPVRAITAAGTGSAVWYLRGGLTNTDIDQGTDAGGAVLLKLVDASTVATDTIITIGNPSPIS
jgi:hypothetical protein